MNASTRKFLHDRFKEYYLQESLEMPPHFQSREWGFILFRDLPKWVMRRHQSFHSRIELVDYVRSMVPLHAYHSAALYQSPGAPTMKEKGWLGADLIFDLDADHLKDAPPSYNEMLNLVKTETLKLLEFLLTDFGFSEDAVSVVFSGGRGYHIHVRDPRVLELGSGERREIVDYLTGRGLNLGKFFFETLKDGDFGVEKASVFGCAPEDAPGWGRRVNRSMALFFENLREMDEDEAMDYLTSRKGVGKVKAHRLYRSAQRDDIFYQVQRGKLDFFKGSPGFWKALIEDYLGGEGVHLGFSPDRDRGETDEPVTTDVKRLIRLPLSLHGGTGLRVTPLTVDGLEAFDPLRDAVVFGDDPAEVCLRTPFELEMRGERYSLREGPAEVPLCVAVFLTARGIAEMGKALD